MQVSGGEREVGLWRFSLAASSAQRVVVGQGGAFLLFLEVDEFLCEKCPP